MKTKKIEIRIGKDEEIFEEIEKTIKMVKEGKHPKSRTIVSFENMKTLRGFLTPNRIKIMSIIKKKKPSSVYELAKELKRDRRHVTEDLTLLRNLGFVELKKEKNLRDMVKPIVNFDKIEIEIPL